MCRKYLKLVYLFILKKESFATLTILISLIGSCFDLEITTIPSEFVLKDDALYFEILWPESLSYTYKVKEARDFGISFNKTYDRVELIWADPEEACQELYNDVRGAVVLILRGECSFLTKTTVAEKAGAVAAIISDNDESNDMSMIDMIDDNSHRIVNIPSLFLLGKDGSMIRKRLRLIHSDRAIINIPINLTGKPMSAARRPPWTIW